MSKKDCKVTDLYDNLDFCKGKPVLPGLAPEAYAIPKAQIAKWPTLPDLDTEGVTMATLAVYADDFVLAADAYWRKIDIVTAASNVQTQSQGEFPSKSFINNLTLKYAGNDEEAAGFCRLANADDLVYCVKTRTGKYRIVGHPDFETDTKPAQDSGMAVTDASGTTLEISGTDVCPAPFYRGKLKLEGKILNCATGELEAAA